MIWLAAVAATIIAVIGVTCGEIIEGTLIAEVGKWVLMGLVIIAILEVFAYVILGPLSHIRERFLKKYGNHWFWHFLKNDSMNPYED